MNAKTEQLELDFTQAEINRNNGMAVAELNAEARHPHWPQEALSWVKTYITFHTEEFLAEDVRKFAEESGLPHPPSERAWGGVICRAARMGLIRKVGYRNTVNPLSHGTPATLWERITPCQ